MAFNIVGFIGLGLIGGSIAKKIKSVNPDTKIYATAYHKETLNEAFKEGIIENDDFLPLSAFSDCDYIFLCAPVQYNIDILYPLKNIIKADCCITDVGSTKTAIHQEVIRLGLESNFIGGHPMTGSEKTGISSSSTTLLENAYYIITPTLKTPPEKIQEFHDFILTLGAIPLVLDYESHDFSTAAISHLPHMLAYTLVNLVQQLDDESGTMKKIAAGGFKDITRIASSSPVMWSDICLSNSEPVLNLIDRYAELLLRLRSLIQTADDESLIEFFQSAKDYRDSMAIQGVRSSVSCYECFVDLPDETGGLASITRVLADHQISIKNIGIVNNREFEEGILHLVFDDENALKLASQLLREEGYTIHNR